MSHATTTTKRLLREASLIASTPSSDYYAAPVSDSNLHEWHFTLRGPTQTPYENGLYHGRITLPPQYPLKPPSFRFLTPSGRFEPNREICLSISNFHEESWNPAWDVRTALTALRPFMAMEPEGQVGGVRASADVRRRLAGESRGWRCPECEGKRMDEILEPGGDNTKSRRSDAPEDVPKLSFGYRDEIGKGHKPSISVASTAPSTESTATSATTTTLASTDTNSSTRGTSTRTTSSSGSGSATPSAQRHSSRSDSRQSVSTSARSSNHPPIWIDAAIAGVVVAIIILLLRRLAASMA